MRYHEKIGKICNDFGKSLKDTGIINSFKDCPISISHLRDIREDSYKYKPDVYYIRKSGKKGECGRTPRVGKSGDRKPTRQGRGRRR